MAERRRMIEPEHPKLSTARQCRLLGLPRSSYYHRPKPKPVEDLALMRVIDEVYLAQPVFGSRQMARWLRRQGYEINRKRVRRLMRLMGLEALYPKPNLSRPRPGQQTVRGQLKPARAGHFKTGHVEGLLLRRR
jgi:putative transposase